MEECSFLVCVFIGLEDICQMSKSMMNSMRKIRGSNNNKRRRNLNRVSFVWKGGRKEKKGKEGGKGDAMNLSKKLASVWRSKFEIPFVRKILPSLSLLDCSHQQPGKQKYYYYYYRYYYHYDTQQLVRAVDEVPKTLSSSLFVVKFKSFFDILPSTIISIITSAATERSID